MDKHIGYIGLGKMGKSMVARLKEKNWRVETYDVNGKGTIQGIKPLVTSFSPPRVIWIMIPAGKAVDIVINELLEYLGKGDAVINGGNSFYEDSILHEQKLAQKRVSFLDVGVSGGPDTVREGKPALMIGGERKVFEKLKPLFADLTRKESFLYMGKAGAGHFVKMVHNGIEYGMMQAIAEGFTIMKQGPFELDLCEIARVYSNGSVIESRLTNWLEKGFKTYGEDLKEVAGSVKHTGESEWAIQTAKKLGVPVPVIRSAFNFRVQSQEKPSYTGKILTLLRHMFGGHSIK